MEHYLTPEEIEELKTSLKKAVPFPETDEIVLDDRVYFDMTICDREYYDRSRATLAKFILDMYYEEKGWEKDYLEESK